MGAEAVLKEWGNSLGVIVPKKFVDENNLKEGDLVNIEKIKRLDFSKIPKIKTGISGQKFKDIAREGWD